MKPEVELLFQNKLNKAILLLVFISVFVNSIVLATEPAEIYIGYLGFIFLLPFFIIKHKAPIGLLIIFGLLLIAGIVNIFLGKNTWPLFLKIYLGLLFSYLFYYYIVRVFEFSIEELFKWYMKGAVIVAAIGMIQFVSYQVGFRFGYDYSWILNKWGIVPGGNFGIRVNSIFGEPTYLATTLAPAFFVAIYNLLIKTPKYINKKMSLLIVAVYLLSFSGLAFAGVMISVLLLLVNFGLVRYVLIFIPISFVLFSFLYNNVEDFRDRYDSTIDIFTTGEYKIGTTHGSSIILYNNYHIAMENFKGNFLFGTGLGSHSIAFEEFSITRDVKTHGFNLNSQDANSMLLRLISETGLFGVILFLTIYFKCFVKRHEEDPAFPGHFWIISNAIFVMITLNLFRQGHYFLNGFPLFVWMYYYNYQLYKEYLMEYAVSKPKVKQAPARIA